MKRHTPFWDAALIVALVLVASICAQSQAQEAEEGRVVTIAPGVEVEDVIIEEQNRIDAEPTFWIGIRGRSIESEVLRTHLQLAQDMGVVVEEVVPDSPADKAGLRKHDIILRANGDAVDNMQVLQTQVRAGNEKPLELKIIRLGRKENVVVVPELRPEILTDRAGPVGRFNGRRLEGDAMQKLLEQFGARNIGPGMVFRGGGQAFNLNQIPNGVSVSIQRNNNEPAQITVKKGDQTWQIVGGDEESLKQLPDDVRPFVERMLKGQGDVQGFGANFDFGNLDAQLEGILPQGLGRLGELAPRGEALRRQFEQQENQMQKRMEQLEKRLQQLQQRFEQKDPPLPAGETS